MAGGLKLKPEDRIQADYFDYLHKKRNLDPRLEWIFAIPNGTNKTEAERFLFRLTGLKAGVWDVCVPFPRMIGLIYSPCYWIEFKYGNNGLTDGQREFRDKVIIPSGAEYGVYYSWIAAAEATLDYLGILSDGLKEELNSEQERVKRKSQALATK